MRDPATGRVEDKARAASWPDFDQDIVAAGFVKEIDVREGSVRIRFELRTRRTDEIDAMSKGIIRARCSESSLPLLHRSNKNQQHTGNCPVESRVMHRRVIH